MPTCSQLDIHGHHGQQVPNTFVSQNNSSDLLGIQLPGYGYTCDMPLFYYTEQVLLDLGGDILNVEYAYNRDPNSQVSGPAAQRERLIADCRAAFDVALARRNYSRLVVIGKSLGTRAMGELLSEDRAWPEIVEAIWLTPLLRDETLRAQIEANIVWSLFMIGSADLHFDGPFLHSLNQHQNVLPIPGVDHSLDIPGDTEASIQALGRAIGTIHRFLT